MGAKGTQNFMDVGHFTEGKEIGLLWHQRRDGEAFFCLTPSAYILPRIGLVAALDLKDG